MKGKRRRSGGHLGGGSGVASSYKTDLRYTQIEIERKGIIVVWSKR